MTGVLLLSGCGGPLSAGDLRSQATQICTAAGHQTAQIATPSAPSGTGAFLSRGLSVMRTVQSQLASLVPPSQDAAAYHAAVGALSQKLDHLERTVAELHRGADPEDTLKRLQARLAPLERAESANWETLGIVACVGQ